MIAEIISTGTELLLGKVVNTNAAWLASQLSRLGIIVKRITVVGDDVEDICSVISEALRRNVDIIIITGGLGPTKDDVTLEGLSKAIGKKLIEYEEVIQDFKKRLGEKFMKKLPIVRKMALLPEGSKPLLNPVGMAPGVMVKCGKTYIFALPGVPKEMEAIFEKYIKPFLKKLANVSVKSIEVSLLIKGLPEALVDQLIRELLEREKLKDVYVKTRVIEEGVELIIMLKHTGINIDNFRKRIRELIESHGGFIVKEVVSQ